MPMGNESSDSTRPPHPDAATKETETMSSDEGGSSYRYVSLLISLLLLALLLPLLGDRRRFLGISVLDLCAIAIVLSAVFAVGPRRRIRTISIALAVPMLVLTGVSELVRNRTVDGAEAAVTALFFSFAAAVILQDVVRAGRVTGNKIVGAICVYLFLGIIWGYLYMLTELLVPGSFDASGLSVHRHLDPSARVCFSDMTYYSFVTLSTLGYGDIVPLSPIARTLSWMEALTGQLYVAILIARLVSLHITQSVVYRESAAVPQDSDGESSS